jgi:uncharacterized LabA/DUF88 family protein
MSSSTNKIALFIDWLDYNGYTVVTKATKELHSTSQQIC